MKHIQATMRFVMVALALCLSFYAGVAAAEVTMMMQTTDRTVSNEKRVAVQRLVALITDYKERRLQLESGAENRAKLAFYSDVVAPSPRSTKASKARVASQVTKGGEINRQLQSNPAGKIFCGTLDDDDSFFCIVEPNFPEEGLLSVFLDCVEGGTLRDCDACVIFKTCCIGDFVENVTEHCEFCNVCSSSVATNFIAWSCSGNSCPEYDCSNTCVGTTTTPAPTPFPTPSPTHFPTTPPSGSSPILPQPTSQDRSPLNDNSCNASFVALEECFFASNCNAGRCFDVDNYENVNGCNDLKLQACQDISCCPACFNSYESAIECLMRVKWDSTCDLGCGRVSGAVPPPRLSPAHVVLSGFLMLSLVLSH